MFVVALVAGPLLIAQAPTLGATLVLTIYVLSVVALFGISAAFHRKDWSPDARRWMRRADHSAIFVAIAGTYTTVAGLALEGWAKLFVLCLVWAGAATGIVLRQVWLDAPKWVVALPAIVVGWSALAVVPQLVRAVGGVGFVLILVGGIFYTVGSAGVRASLARSDPPCLRVSRGFPRLHRGGSDLAIHSNRRVRASTCVISRRQDPVLPPGAPPDDVSSPLERRRPTRLGLRHS